MMRQPQLTRCKVEEPGVLRVGSVLAIGFVATTLAMRVAAAQAVIAPFEVARHYGSTLTVDDFGATVVVLGDLDDDGCDDYAVGSPLRSTNLPQLGRVDVYSGRTQSVLTTILPTSQSGRFGRSIARLGDCNFDGVDDFAVSSDPEFGVGNSIRIFSGIDRSLIATYQASLGADVRVCAAGDLNGDGAADLLIGCPNSGLPSLAGAGRIEAIALGVATPYLIAAVDGTIAGEHLGFAVESLGQDLTGDGISEIVVGCPDAIIFYFGRVHVMSPPSFNIISTSFDFDPAPYAGNTENLGSRLGTGGDVDGDGVFDYLVTTRGGNVKVKNAITAATIGSVPFEVFNGPPANYRENLAIVTDLVDDDAYADIVVGQGFPRGLGPDGGSVKIYSATAVGGAITLTALPELTFGHFGDFFGAAVDHGDFNGDGHPEILIGSPRHDDVRISPSLDIGAVTIMGIRELSYAEGTTEDGGGRVAKLGDIDGDLVADFSVAYMLSAASPGAVQRIDICSGRTKTVIRSHSKTSGTSAYGFAVDDIGDVTQDGVADYLIGDPGIVGTAAEGGGFEVRSGADGALVPGLMGSGIEDDQKGYAVAGLGDVNGDGIPDFAVASPLDDHLTFIPTPNLRVNGGKVEVYSGATGAVLSTILGGFDNRECGRAIASVADYSGDGVRELAVGIPGYSTSLANRGRVEIRSPVTGSLITGGSSFNGGAVGDRAGTSIADAGDVDGDGVSDVAIGIPFMDTAWGVDVGGVTICRFPGATTVSASFGQRADDRFGTSVAALGDIDGDLLGDLAVGAPGHDFGVTPTDVLVLDSGAVFIVNSESESVAIHSWPAANRALGEQVASAGDQNGDGRDDILVGTGPGSTSIGAWIESFGNVGLEPFGDGTIGCNGRIRLFANHPPVVGSPTFSLVTSNCPPNSSGLAVFCPQSARVTPGVDPFGFGLIYHFDIAQNVYLTQSTYSNVNGVSVNGLPIPPIPFLAGFAFIVQEFWYAGPCSGSSSGYATTNGLEVTILP